jgi:hypothetical protein
VRPFRATARVLIVSMGLVVALGALSATASPAQAACPGSGDTHAKYTNSNTTVTISGDVGWVWTSPPSKDPNHNSTCLDINMTWVSHSDFYAAQYRSSSGSWITGSGGRVSFSSGNVSPWWTPIDDLPDGTYFRMWSSGYNRLITTAS